MKNRAADVLLKFGMPCNIKGFHYIVHSMVLFDNGWANRKTCELYKKIAEDLETTASRVERDMRQAFSYVYKKCNFFEVEKYFDDWDENTTKISWTTIE